MARRKVAGSPLSLLDTLSCAFGGVIVLSVVFSAMVREREAVQHESYLMVDARLEPVGSTPPELVRKFALTFEVREPQGGAVDFDSLDGQVLKSSVPLLARYEFSSHLRDRGAGEDEIDSGVLFAYSILTADRVRAGRYTVRLRVEEGPSELDLNASGAAGAQVRAVVTVRSLYSAGRPEPLETVVSLCRLYNQARNQGFWAPCAPGPPGSERLFRPVEISIQM
jgi:hypothetical protein